MEHAERCAIERRILALEMGGNAPTIEDLVVVDVYWGRDGYGYTPSRAALERVLTSWKADAADRAKAALEAAMASYEAAALRAVLWTPAGPT